MALKEKLLTLPHKPGVYLHKDKDGTIIYVGKAINLFNRVNSYFRGAHNYKTTKLVSEIVDFDYIITKSEKEALVLEYNLIKQYNPKYNVVFKDDASYPYILIDDSLEPHVSVVRKKKKSRFKGKTFGPYPDVGAARNVVEIINRLYPTRKCQHLQNQLCLYFHINQCPGYCVNPVNQSDKIKVKREIENFLMGDTKQVITDLKEKMNGYVETLNFEQAAKCRDLINDIDQCILKVNVQNNNNHESFDVFNYYLQDGYIALTGLFIKKGILLSSEKHLDYLVGDPENYVSSYIYQFYEINPKPTKLYVPSNLLPYLDGNFNCFKVTRGYKYQLLKQANENSIEYLNQNKKIAIKKADYDLRLDEEFAKIFGKKIKRIELFDNSHTAGVDTVGAMVVYEDFHPNKKEYRLFKLEEGADDLKSMHEMLYRRYFRVLKDNLPLTDLLVVDGGINQIEVAKQVIDSLGLDITIVGLGKDDHHNTAYLMDANLNKIIVDVQSNLFFFLANMQDEVHRFAITYHKKLRTKSVYKSPLDGVEGLGEKSRIKLLKKYKSIAKIKECSLEELQTVLNKKVASRLYNKLQGKEDVKEHI